MPKIQLNCVSERDPRYLPKADKNLTITAFVIIIPFLRVPITKQSAGWPPFFFNEIYLNKTSSFLWLWKQKYLIFQNISSTSI